MGGEDYEYAGSDDIDKVAWCNDNSDRKTHPVAQKKPNGYGLYDMSGNVWEWCADDYDNQANIGPVHLRRAVRGGSWRNFADVCRMSSRSRGSLSDRRDRYLGLRLSGHLTNCPLTLGSRQPKAARCGLEGLSRPNIEAEDARRRACRRESEAACRLERRRVACTARPPTRAARTLWLTCS